MPPCELRPRANSQPPAAGKTRKTQQEVPISQDESSREAFLAVRNVITCKRCKQTAKFILKGAATNAGHQAVQCKTCDTIYSSSNLRTLIASAGGSANAQTKQPAPATPRSKPTQPPLTTPRPAPTTKERATPRPQPTKSATVPEVSSA